MRVARSGHACRGRRVANVTVRDHALAFECRGERLVGVVSASPCDARAGVVIVVGGSQYRAGSQRQYVLLARRLAAAGIPTLRFDYRGMGDSTGARPPFDALDPDIAAAIDALQAACPGVERVGLWGLCDAASAALLYCARTRDRRVGGVALLNPWVRSEQTLARTHLKHYYVSHLASRSFWDRLLRGEVDVLRAVRSLAERVARAGGASRTDRGSVSFQDVMAQGLAACRGPVAVVLSREDLTAREFLEHVAASATWERLLAGTNVSRLDIAADHTFSSAAWRDEVAAHTLAWAQRIAEDVVRAQPVIA